MKFVQLVEFRTSRYDEVAALMDEWVARTEGERTAQWSMTTRDRETSDTYIEVVLFPSYEDAMRNSELPETDAFAEKIKALCDGPPVFRNLDVVREDEL
jgi:hypothetical protein